MISINNDLTTINRQSLYSSSVAEKQSEEAVSSYNNEEEESLDEAAVLSISNQGLKQAKELRNIMASEESKTADEEDENETDLADVSATRSKIQKYLSRGVQLSIQASDDSLSQSDRQTIQREINKIKLEISNLSIGSDTDSVDSLNSNIDMNGDVVASSVSNILASPYESYMAQATNNNAMVYSLLQ